MTRVTVAQVPGPWVAVAVGKTTVSVGGQLLVGKAKPTVALGVAELPHPKRNNAKSSKKRLIFFTPCHLLLVICYFQIGFGPEEGKGRGAIGDLTGAGHG